MRNSADNKDDFERPRECRRPTRTALKVASESPCAIRQLHNGEELSYSHFPRPLPVLATLDVGQCALGNGMQKRFC